MCSSELYTMLPTIFVAIFFLFFVLSKGKRRHLPPGPNKLPIIGNLHQLGRLPHRSLKQLSQKYGDLMFLQLGSVPALVVSSPDMAREIIKGHDLVFSGRPALYSAKKLCYNYSDITFAPYGEYWREVRKLLVLELMTVRRVQSFEKARADEVSLMVDHIIRQQHPKHPVDLSELTFDLSNNFVRRVAFGMTYSNGDHGASDGNFQQIFRETQELAGMFNIADYFPRMAWMNRFNGINRRMDKNFRDLDEYFDKVMKEHADPKRPEPDHEDIIDVLLRVQKDPNQTINLTDEQLKAILLDIFVAGTDTTAATVVWTMAELMRNPKVKEKVQQEVRELVKGKAKVEEPDLSKLKYLTLVIKESWRLHPPAPLLVPRETTEKCTIGKNYEISAKTRVFFNAAAIGTDPSHWENPEKFWPERFLNSQIDFRGQHFELLPFGAGRRQCPAINFAIPLVELVLANLLFRFEWELPKGMSAENIDMEEAQGITTHKNTPLYLIASSSVN